MRVTDTNQVVLNPDEVIELWMRGGDTSCVAEGDAVTVYNDLCETYNRRGAKIRTDVDEPFDMTWFVGDELRDVDLRDYFLSLVEADVERERVNEEMDLFERYDLVPVLRAMIYLVAHFRSKGVVWGVGRGSSVASYLLYLIGVHRIDPLRFDLPITDFIKP